MGLLRKQIIEDGKMWWDPPVTDEEIATIERYLRYELASKYSEKIRAYTVMGWEAGYCSIYTLEDYIQDTIKRLKKQMKRKPLKIKE